MLVCNILPTATCDTFVFSFATKSLKMYCILEGNKTLLQGFQCEPRRKTPKTNFVNQNKKFSSAL